MFPCRMGCQASLIRASILCGVVAKRGGWFGGALGLIRRKVMACACLWSLSTLYTLRVSCWNLALRYHFCVVVLRGGKFANTILQTSLLVSSGSGSGYYFGVVVPSRVSNRARHYRGRCRCRCGCVCLGRRLVSSWWCA